MQPGYCADIMLHETAVSWIRQGRVELWAPRMAQLAACSENICFYKRSLTEPVRNLRKLQGQRSANQVGPSGAGGSFKENAQLVKLDRTLAREALGAAHSAVGSVLRKPVFL